MQHFKHARGAGHVMPKSDEAPAGGRGFRENGKADTPDCADAEAHRKRIATAQARAALVGLEMSPVPDGAWCLTYAAAGSAGHVKTVQSLQAAEAALIAFEQVRAETLALIDGMRCAR